MDRVILTGHSSDLESQRTEIGLCPGQSHLEAKVKIAGPVLCASLVPISSMTRSP